MRPLRARLFPGLTWTLHGLSDEVSKREIGTVVDILHGIVLATLLFRGFAGDWSIKRVYRQVGIGHFIVIRVDYLYQRGACVLVCLGPGPDRT